MKLSNSPTLTVRMFSGLTYFCAIFTLVKCELIKTSFSEVLNVLNDNKALSEKCWEEITKLDLASFLAMMDANGKTPSGILNGNFFSLGDFDQCYNIQSDTIDPPIHGKYCLGTIPIPQESIPQKDRNVKFLLETAQSFIPLKTIAVHPRILGTPETSGPHLGICIPSGCTAEEVSGLFLFTEEFCYSKDHLPEFDAGAIVTSAIIFIFLVLVGTSTTMDVFVRCRNFEHPYPVMVMFSMVTNGQKLLKSNDADQLLCLNGIRALSMMWVILGHVYTVASYSMYSNFFYLMEFQEDIPWYDMFLLNGTLSVDTFLLLSGLLVTYTFLKATGQGQKFNILLYYLHRYIRLTPILGIIILIHAYIVKHLGTGPIWGVIDQLLGQPCRESWWNTFFYIENFTRRPSCIPQSWYLSVDIQLFLLSPILLLPLLKWPKYTLWFMYSLAVIGVIIPFTVAYVLKLSSFVQTDKYTFYYYIQTHTRFTPYVVGMITGYFLYKLKKSVRAPKLSSLTVSILWTICLAGLLSTILAGLSLTGPEYDRVGNAVFIGLNRASWALLVCLMIFLCVAGYGGPINGFLSHPVFQFLARVSYSMYLIHYAVISVRFQSMKTVYKISHIEMINSFFENYVNILIISVLLCLIFESPILAVEKFMTDRGKTWKLHGNVQV